MNAAVAQNQLLNANLVLGTANGNQAFTFTNNSLTNSLGFAGGISSTTTGTKTLTVTGWGGAASISGALTNGSGTLALTKSGAGTLTLTGANSYTGATTVNDGKLLLDMNAGGALAITSPLTLGGGTFEIKGKASGATVQTMGALTAWATNNTGSKIVLNPNGGDGTTLVLGDTWNRWANGSSLLIDYSSASSGTRQVVTANAVTGQLVLTNGIFGSILVKDSAGVTGFATRAAGANQPITRYNDETLATTLTTSSNNINTNFTTRNSTYTGGNGGTLLWATGGKQSVNSLTIDTTTNWGTIDMGAAINYLAIQQGNGGILFKGGHDAILTGGRIGAPSTLNEFLVHQTGTGTLTINSPIFIDWTGPLTKDGDGLLVLGGANYYPGATVVNAGTLRAAVATVPGVSGAFGLNSPVFLADVEGATLDANNFDIAIGALAGGGPLGGNVTLGTAALTVGGNNGAGTYAGVISSTASTGSLTKIGTGVQTLTGANTYTGATSITKGGLTLAGTAGSLPNTAAVTVTGNATLIDGDATLANNNDKSNRINSAAPLTLGGGAADIAWGGTFSLYKPAAGTISQSLTSLTVATGASTIQNQGTGGTATLNFTSSDSGSVYTRSAGGTVNFASAMTSFTNAPSTNTSAGDTGDTILIGAFLNNADFVKAAAGTVIAPAYDTQNNPALWGTVGYTGNITSAAISGTTAGGAVSINALRSTGAGTFAIGASGADSLSIKSGMILSTNTLAINGPGTLTSGNSQDLIINNSNTVTVNAPISVTGALTKTGAGTLSLTSTANSIGGNIYFAGTLDFNAAGTATYANTITGPGAITKNGTAAMNLTGPVSIGGAFTVNAGTASLAGPASLAGAVTVKGGGTLQWSNAYSAPGTSTGNIFVGSAGAARAVASISVPPGSTLKTGGIWVGDTNTGNGGSAAGHELTISGGTVNLQGNYMYLGRANATGTLNVSGADTLITSAGGNNHFDPGSGANGIGYYNQSGGTVSFQYSDWGNGGSVIAYQTAGTNKVRGLGESGGGTSSYTITGGTVNGMNLCGGPGGGSNSGDGANATLNVLGGTVTAGSMYLAGSTTTRTGMTATLNVAGGEITVWDLPMSASAVGNSVVNLSGGTLTVGSGIYIFNGTPLGTSTMNLGGGTIKYGSNSGTGVNAGSWMKALTNAYVFPGGVTINTQTYSGTISQVLKAATGSGVASVTLIDGGTGYTAAPVVSFTGGSAIDDNDAEAVATFDRATGKVTGIVIVNPGQYSTLPTGVVFSNPVPGSSPNVWTTAATANIGSTASNAGGGLTKTGAGTLTLTGASTYNGSTIVQQGILSYGSTGDDLDDASTVEIFTGAKINLNFSGTPDTKSELWLGGVKMNPGTYNATSHSAYFTGAGSLLVKIPLPDTNGDGVVDTADYIALKQNFGMTSGASLAQGDVDSDGDVDWDDLQVLMSNFGAGSGTTPATTPEPATLGLLAIGALAVLRRNRRS